MIAVYVYTATVAWALVVLYGRRIRKWRRSAIGWNLWAFTLVIAVAFTLIAWPGSEPWRVYAWRGLVIGISALMTHRLLMLISNVRQEP